MESTSQETPKAMQIYNFCEDFKFALKMVLPENKKKLFCEYFSTSSKFDENVIIVPLGPIRNTAAVQPVEENHCKPYNSRSRLEISCLMQTFCSLKG